MGYLCYVIQMVYIFCIVSLMQPFLFKPKLKKIGSGISVLLMVIVAGFFMLKRACGMLLYDSGSSRTLYALLAEAHNSALLSKFSARTFKYLYHRRIYLWWCWSLLSTADVVSNPFGRTSGHITISSTHWFTAVSPN